MITPHLNRFQEGQALGWWRLGRDTQQIADILCVSEAAVYNTLAEHRERMRQEAAA